MSVSTVRFFEYSILTGHVALCLVLGALVTLDPEVFVSHLKGDASVRLPLASFKEYHAGEIVRTASIAAGVLGKVGTLLIGEALLTILLSRLQRGPRALGFLLLSSRALLTAGALFIVRLNCIKMYEDKGEWILDPRVTMDAIILLACWGAFLLLGSFLAFAGKGKKRHAGALKKGPFIGRPGAAGPENDDEEEIRGGSLAVRAVYGLTTLLGLGSGIALLIAPASILLPNLYPTTIQFAKPGEIKRAVEVTRLLGPFLIYEGCFACYLLGVSDNRTHVGATACLGARGLLSGLAALRNQLGGDFNEKNWADPILSFIFFFAYFWYFQQQYTISQTEVDPDLVDTPPRADAPKKGRREKKDE